MTVADHNYIMYQPRCTPLPFRVVGRYRHTAIDTGMGRKAHYVGWGCCFVLYRLRVFFTCSRLPI